MFKQKKTRIIVYVVIVLLLFYAFYFTQESNIRLFRYLITVENYKYPKLFNFFYLCATTIKKILIYFIGITRFIKKNIKTEKDIEVEIDDALYGFILLIPIIQWALYMFICIWIFYAIMRPTYNTRKQKIIFFILYILTPLTIYVIYKLL